MKRTNKANLTVVPTKGKPVAVVTPTKPITAKRLSHLKLGPALLARKASDAEIKKAFTESFNARGKTDQAWIDKRIGIYMNIAMKKAGIVKTAVTK